MNEIEELKNKIELLEARINFIEEQHKKDKRNKKIKNIFMIIFIIILLSLGVLFAYIYLNSINSIISQI